jgi:hypothetical protein
MRDMSGRKQDYKDRGVEIVAVNVFEDPQVVREWIASSGLDYRWAFADAAAREALGIEAVPAQVILDRDGKVAWTSSMTSLFGGADAVFAALDEAL